MPEIIGLMGVIGSGKNYQQELLVKKGFIALDFKDALIDMCEDIVGYKIRDHYEDFKICIVGTTHGGFNKGLTPTQHQLAQYPNIMTGRRLLQRVGTEVMRKRDPDYWVDAWCAKCKDYILGGHSVVSADVRFRNEARAIVLGGKALEVPTKIIFNDYKSDRYDAKSTHESEYLAQKLLDKGLKDGDEVTLEMLD